MNATIGEAAMQNIERSARELAAVGDPAETAERQAAKRVEELVDNVTDLPIGHLRDLRDKIDDTIRAMVESRNLLKRDIERQSDLAAQAIKLKEIVAENLDQLTGSVAQSLERPVSRTITARARNNGK